MMPEELSVAVLAGGKSRRFGAPKDRASFNNRSLLQIALDLAAQIAPRSAVIIGDDKLVPPPPVPCYRDILPGKGPLGGIYTALSHAPTRLVATVPCDMPLLIPPVYKILIENQRGDRPVAAVSEKGLEPLVAVWPLTAQKRIYEWLTAGEYSIRKPLQDLRAVEVYLPDVLDSYRPEIFLNINYWQDLEWLKSQKQFAGSVPVQNGI